MNLSEFTAPLPKPWLDINCDELNCRLFTADSMAVNHRLTQETIAGGHLTPYTLWRSLAPINVAGTTLVFAMSTYVGPALIPASSLYAGQAVKIIVGGTMATTGANNMTISIRNIANTYTHASLTLAQPGPTAGRAVWAEFNIQINAVGGPGVGQQSAVANGFIDPNVGAASNSTDSATFDSTNGVEYALYIQHSAVGSTFAKNVSYCTLEA